VPQGSSTSLVVGVAGSPASPGLQWRRNGTPIPGETHAALDLIEPAADANYDVTLTTSCGQAVSNLARVTILPACYPNCDFSTSPPVLNISDFTCFLNRFAAGHRTPTAIRARPRRSSMSATLRASSTDSRRDAPSRSV
jgi:hypothetical protein